MKKTYFYAGLLFITLSTATITSCSSEEATVQQKQTTAKIEKTPEMEKLEKALVSMEMKQSL